MNNREDQELRQIATDMADGKVFADVFCRDPNDIPTVFMILTMLDDEQVNEMKQNDVCMLFEYMEKALPRTINGYPCFLSMEMLNRADALKVMEYYQGFLQLKEEFINENTDN